jgi:hypothetical protein
MFIFYQDPKAVYDYVFTYPVPAVYTILLYWQQKIAGILPKYCGTSVMKTGGWGVLFLNYFYLIFIIYVH